MNWDDLRVFDAAARMHGVTAASRVLGVSQPQMSRRLRAFEDKMGARLFDRTPNGLMLTPAGEKLLPLAQQMRLVAEGVERVRPELAQNQRRVLRISLDEVRENFITTHLKELMADIGVLVSRIEHPAAPQQRGIPVAFLVESEDAGALAVGIGGA